MLFGYFVLALLPILWLIVAMSVIKMQAWTAALTAMVIAFVEAMVFWHASLLSATTSVAEGVVMALWPIVLVIIAAIFVYNMTVHTGAMDVIKSQLTSVSNDRRVLAILIAFLAPFVAFVNSIPACVMGGVCVALYGFIAVSGLKMVQKVDLEQNKNVFVVSAILIAGIGGLSLTIGKVTITSIACALILGILVNVILNLKKESPAQVDTDNE